MSIEPRQGWPRSGQAEGPTLRSKECGATPMCHHHLRSIENRQPRRATAKHSTKHDHGKHRRSRPGPSPLSKKQKYSREQKYSRQTGFLVSLLPGAQRHHQKASVVWRELERRSSGLARV
jgi:hypothetical protein